MATGDHLITEGEKADYVYIVRKGKLQAYHVSSTGVETALGDIERGEFVGEMAYIAGQARSAHVRAVTDCELIEIPIGTLDKLLYQRPAWSKTLMATLTKRLKNSNEKITRAAASGPDSESSGTG
jgi:CRP-like cAMP-binding protein